MKEWLYALINILPWPLDAAARRIADRIYSVWSDGVRFAKWIKIGIKRWYDGMIPLLSGLREFFYEATYTLLWLATKEIPRRVARALRSAIEYAASIVTQVRDAILGLLSNLRRWTEARINDIASFISGLTDWVRARLAALQDLASRLVDRVFGLWATPGRLATWLIAALWSAALAHLYQQRERIATWFLRSSGAFTMWLARQIESILVRLL